MPVATQSRPPCQFTAGDTVIFSASFPEYPATLWTLDYILSRSGQNLATVRATASGADFLVTMDGTASNLAPGPAQWLAAVTEIATSERKIACSGIVGILYNPTANLPATANQTMLAACNAALLTLTTTANYKVDFNGQMFERQRIGELMKIRDRLQVMVWDELRAMGVPQPGGARIIQQRFSNR